MTAPGGFPGDDQRPTEQPISNAPWVPPSTPPPVDYPDTAAYPPPGYPTYGPGGLAGNPPYPPPMPPQYGGYPGGYYPGWGHAPGGYGAPRTGMNTMAIVSLIAGVLGIFCCVGSIVGIVCGTVGLNQIKQTREDGHGLAVSGIVISVATLLFYFVVLALGARG
ncbi:DUF4190 domain-containing protein [Mycobacterium asiaticum]|nr:DUF4190 domain-containing protein [Mycobacterium asiaticum]